MLETLNLESCQSLTRDALKSVLQNLNTVPKPLYEAMGYALLAPGKRLRPYLAVMAGALFNLSWEHILPVILSIECIHTYSLIHDDLPCMDDADLRRGQPTLHLQFDEATAVLTGDALLTLAFEVLAEPTVLLAGKRCQLINLLARASGPTGMIGGQTMDMQGEKSESTVDEILTMQALKTGKLIEFALCAPAIIADASCQHYEALKTYAHAIGCAYQISDDILDHQGSANIVGKSVGRDDEQRKSTLIRLLGLQGAQNKLNSLVDQAMQSLMIFDNPQPLVAFAGSLLTRQR